MKGSKGCIKDTRGPWIVRRKDCNGHWRTSLRRPSDCERENNCLREKNRRAMSRKIFSCLKMHGSFDLPKYPSQNDILIALCREAGYVVEEDGTIIGKENPNNAEDGGTSFKTKTNRLDSGALDATNAQIDLSLTLGRPGSI